MTSRERVIAALNFKEADRVPVDWGMSTVSGIHEIAYRNLLKHLGMEEEIILHDPVQRLALPSEEILEKFQVDTRYVFCNGSSKWTYEEKENGTWTDEFGTTYLRTELYCDGRQYPLANAVSIEDLKAFKMPDPEDPARFRGLREKAKWLHENTDYAVVAGTYPALYYCAWMLRGMENFMSDTIEDPAFANYLLDMLLDYWKAYMGKYLDEVGDYIDIMWAGDDWGDQYGPLINPIEFRKNVGPRFKELIQFMKSKSKAKLAYHSCGSVAWCVDDLYDWGVDIIQPVQANAFGNDSKKIKEMTYGKMTIHGGLNNQGVFHLGPEEIEADVKQKMHDYAKGGGYIFGSGHNIQANCPPENILAIFNSYKKYCEYK